VLPLTTGNVGLVSGSPAAANAAACVSLRTAYTGRSFRGRFYVGGLPQAAFGNAHLIDSGTAAALSGYFEDFITGLNTINKTLVVVSNYAAGVVRLIALATEVNAVITDTKIDSQRRRTAN